MNAWKERDRRAYKSVKLQASPHAGLTRCLMCEEWFRSVDVRCNRRCHACAHQVENLTDRFEDGWI